MSCTSTGLLEIELVIPFSLVMLLELLLGELGPEPGALLQADSLRKEHMDTKSNHYGILALYHYLQQAALEVSL